MKYEGDKLASLLEDFGWPDKIHKFTGSRLGGNSSLPQLLSDSLMPLDFSKRRKKSLAGDDNNLQ